MTGAGGQRAPLHLSERLTPQREDSRKEEDAMSDVAREEEEAAGCKV